MEVGSEVRVARVVAKTLPLRFSRTQSWRDAAPSTAAAVGTADVRRSAKSTGSGVEGALLGVTEVVAVAVRSTGALASAWASQGEELRVDRLGAAVFRWE